MKNIFILLISFLLTFSVFAQRNPDQGGPGNQGRDIRERLEQFEKVRLLEILKLDEETAVKFILRRNENRRNMQSIMDKRFTLIKKLQEKLSSENVSDKELQKLIDDILQIEKDLATERKKFVASLSDILTTKEIAKVITFEARFKDDIKEFMGGKRRPPEEEFHPME